MKLTRLFLETDAEQRELERRVASGDSDAEDELFRWKLRTGQPTLPIPPELAGTPSKILKVHEEQFNGNRWPEFEELILNYKRTKSFELGRTGDFTFPTLVEVRYDLQLNEPWSEFLPLAGHMMNFLYNPAHTRDRPGRTGGNYETPLRAHRIKKLPLMLAKYLVKHKLKPEWTQQLYDILSKEWESSLTPWRQNAETGQFGPGVEEGEPYVDPYTGQTMFGWHRNSLQDDEAEVELSRVVPQLKRLLG